MKRGIFFIWGMILLFSCKKENVQWQSEQQILGRWRWKASYLGNEGMLMQQSVNGYEMAWFFYADQTAKRFQDGVFAGNYTYSLNKETSIWTGQEGDYITLTAVVNSDQDPINIYHYRVMEISNELRLLEDYPDGLEHVFIKKLF